MATAGNETFHPYYREVHQYVRDEIERRAKIYGSKIRDNAEELRWSYGKTAWGMVTGGEGSDKVVLGEYFGKYGVDANNVDNGRYMVQPNAPSKLLLYDSVTKRPKYPLLQSIEVETDSRNGSIFRTSFSFTVYPEIRQNGNFDIDKIERAFFSPGKEVEIEFGWSVDTLVGLQRQSNRVNKGPNFDKLIGVIYNFDWSINPDLSLTGKVSACSPGSLTIGISGEQTNPDLNREANTVIPNADIPGIITKDLNDWSKRPLFVIKDLFALPEGFTTHGGSLTNSGLYYYGVGMPIGEMDQQTQQFKKTVVKPVFYTALKDLAKFFTERIYNNPDDNNVKKLLSVQVDNNFTTYLGNVGKAGIKSAIPEEVFFPDTTGGMSQYGFFAPRWDDKPDIDIRNFTNPPAGVDSSKLLNLGNILIATSTVIEIYKSLLSENQTSVELKNVTKFWEKICDKINFATGEMFQLSPYLIDLTRYGKNSEPFDSILSIEDSNLTREWTKKVEKRILKFEPSVTKPIVKSMTISSKPPAAAAHAAFAMARAPRSRVTSDVKYTKGDDNRSITEYDNAIKQINELSYAFSYTGAGEYFTKGMRGNYTAIKRTANSDGESHHWLNRIIFPIEFSITIDGIQGFRFGDVITTSYLPDSYIDTQSGEDLMVFQVTKISHSVKDGVWETTLNTAARMKPR